MPLRCGSLTWSGSRCCWTRWMEVLVMSLLLLVVVRWWCGSKWARKGVLYTHIMAIYTLPYIRAGWMHISCLYACECACVCAWSKT